MENVLSRVNPGWSHVHCTHQPVTTTQLNLMLTSNSDFRLNEIYFGFSTSGFEYIVGIEVCQMISEFRNSKRKSIRIDSTYGKCAYETNVVCGNNLEIFQQFNWIKYLWAVDRAVNRLYSNVSLQCSQRLTIWSKRWNFIIAINGIFHLIVSFRA